MRFAYRSTAGRAGAVVPGPPPASPRVRRSPRAHRVLATASAVGALLALAACSGGGESAEDRKSPSADRPSSVEPPPLRFHPVEAVTNGPCPPEEPGVWIENTSAPDAECLRLRDAAALRLSAPVEAAAELSQTAQGWTVNIALSEEDGRRFGELSANAAVQTPPKNRIAIVLGEGDGGRVLSAPQVSQRISGGNIVVSGNFSEKDAQKLAAELNG
ncbi:hypothetical protein [Streptomyces sp. JJ38]|uniref:SecDF P1 head subdomain-containing protein n=1 Tax=Streptomyces sp. JJ38 TaxID=2738128 RepID=UPI001C588C4E|nr:hypothetical protein [Streptomyces sp. JJ38]MBW1596667.1 hypothetical protein [Streptomyces sp. JJ38]